MVAGFYGTYEHTLDDKGRVILPAKMRHGFDGRAFLTQYLDGCLALWDPEAFDEQMEAMRQRASTGRSERNLARVWASKSHEVEVASNGRVAIPAHLREYAGLEGDVLITGFFDHVELWNPARWEEKVQPEELRLTEGLDG